jgi:hypothetical protein
MWKESGRGGGGRKSRIRDDNGKGYEARSSEEKKRYLQIGWQTARNRLAVFI